MKKKRQKSAAKIQEIYMDFITQHQKKPESIAVFCDELELETDNFYKHYKSFQQLDKEIFNAFFTNSLEVLAASEDFENFDNKNKMLSFYFTFFENLSLNSDYVGVILGSCKKQLSSYKTLSLLKKNFTKFIQNLSLTESILPIEGLESFQQKIIAESAWFQLILTLKFWLTDASSNKEKTDIFIEKSINTSFELIENKFLKNAFDLGKFVYQEKFTKSN